MKMQIDDLLRNLQERTKELNCLYNIEELLNKPFESIDELFEEIIRVIPSGWQYPELCKVKIVFENNIYKSKNYKDSPINQIANIVVQGKIVGQLQVCYTKEVPQTGGDYFLKEESKLINNIANRIGHTILHKRLRDVFNNWEKIKEEPHSQQQGKWRVILDTLQKSDKKLFEYISRKMLNYLCWNNIEEAKVLLQQFGTINKNTGPTGVNDENRPSKKYSIGHIVNLSEEIFKIASDNLSEDQILYCIQKWFQEDKSLFLVKAVENPNSVLFDIADAITRYHYLGSEDIGISPSIEKGLRVTLVRLFFSDQLEFINISKNFIELDDYYDLIQRIIYPNESRGKLGGKSAGLFLATQILKKSNEYSEILGDLKIPKTWYITSDGLTSFLHYNNLEDVIEHKFKDIEEVNREYQNIIQIFKNSFFPPEIIKGLSIVIDDFGETPIIVRSSSLLEDRIGAAFSGKYKSLFLANQGSKEQRLEALTDAIAEIYASTFGPDPISYRAEKGLLDYHEEMAIMIQAVVGNHVGQYYIPTFAGVALSCNEFRWSPRISREDGLIRIVPGLGTRAVDRVADDYPILIAPGKPELKTNVTPDERIRYSPKKIDVINLKNNAFETIEIEDLLREHGSEISGIQHVLSIYKDNLLKNPSSLFNIDFDNDNTVVTFEGLISKTPFLKQIKALLDILQEKMGTPIDIEFAHDGENLYLLQCRSQNYSREYMPTPIPKDIPNDKIIFSANRFISDGYVPDISHIVYVDPYAYSKLSNLSELKSIGKVIGKLNKILPKRQFILMGPGRWGSRGDIKLGVSVTYSEINNTAVLIEIARKVGNYTPDLSFGTHFFQDLVESSICYLPLYPDNGNCIFNEIFLEKTNSILSELLPEYASLSDIVRVIDVPQNTDGMVLRILMNADLGESIAYLTDPSQKTQSPVKMDNCIVQQVNDFWKWRLYMAEKMASQLDPERFGVKGFYVFGSTKNATAKPSSDINIIIHFNGSKEQKEKLQLWLEGWNLTLAEMNYLRTGYRSDGLLDIHFVSDEDIAKKTNYAVKIDAVTDAAKPLRLKTPEHPPK